jgi:ribose transport system ATP-binding protein
VLVPGDRRREGVWMAATAAENMSLPYLGGYYRGWLRTRDELRTATRLTKQFGVRPPNPHQMLIGFSGGNQQKILLAKWLQANPRVLLLIDPTQGVDVGARAEIHNILREAAAGGTAVIVSSSDEAELEELCSRVLIFRHGRVRQVLRHPAATSDAIVEACQTTTVEV